MLYLKSIFFLLLLLSVVWAKRVTYSGDKSRYYNKEKKIELIGNAKVNSGDGILTARKIELFNKDKIAIATGNVVLVSEDSTYNGERITYDFGDKKVYCESRSKIVNAKDKMFLEADRITGNLETDKMEFFSNVYLKQYRETNSVEVFSDYGNYNSKTAIANLVGNGKVVTSNSHAYADKLRYFDKDEKVLLIGNAWIKSYEKNATNDIKAQLIDYHLSSNEVFYCFTNVELHDNKNSNIIYSQALEYYPKSKYTYVSGEPKLISENSNIVIVGKIFERFEFENIMYIKGNVEITAQGQKATSSLALYWIEKKEMLLYGLPSIKTTNKMVLFAEIIRFDVEKQLFRMEKQIIGNLGQ